MIPRIVMLILPFTLLVGSAQADFTLTTGLDMRLEYNDNFDLDTDNEKDDFIATVSPNMTLTLDTKFIELSLDGSVIMEKYLDHDEEDSFGANGDGGLNASTLFSLYQDNLFLRVSNTYSRVVIDEGGRSGENNRKVNQTDSNRFQLNPYLQFQPSENTSMRLGYTYENLWYKEKEGDDAENHSYNGTLSHVLTDRVTTTLYGSYLMYRPKDVETDLRNSDGGEYEYDQINLSAGLSFEATDRLLLSGSFGHTWFYYDVLNDTDSQVWSAALEYEITSAYKTGAEYSGNYVYSVDDGPSKEERISAYLAYDDRFSLKVGLFAAKSTFEEIDRNDDSYGGSLSGELPFNDKTGLTGLFSYVNLDRTGLDAEEYDRYSTSVALYYEIRLGRLLAGYTYTKNDSNLSGDNYTNNIIYISASLRF